MKESVLSAKRKSGIYGRGHRDLANSLFQSRASWTGSLEHSPTTKLKSLPFDRPLHTQKMQPSSMGSMLSWANILSLVTSQTLNMLTIGLDPVSYALIHTSLDALKDSSWVTDSSGRNVGKKLGKGRKGRKGSTMQVFATHLVGHGSSQLAQSLLTANSGLGESIMSRFIGISIGETVIGIVFPNKEQQHKFMENSMDMARRRSNIIKRLVVAASVIASAHSIVHSSPSLQHFMATSPWLQSMQQGAIMSMIPVQEIVDYTLDSIPFTKNNRHDPFLNKLTSVAFQTAASKSCDDLVKSLSQPLKPEMKRHKLKSVKEVMTKVKRVVKKNKATSPDLSKHQRQFLDQLVQELKGALPKRDERHFLDQYKALVKSPDSFEKIHLHVRELKDEWTRAIHSHADTLRKRSKEVDKIVLRLGENLKSRKSTQVNNNE